MSSPRRLILRICGTCIAFVGLVTISISILFIAARTLALLRTEIPPMTSEPWVDNFHIGQFLYAGIAMVTIGVNNLRTPTYLVGGFGLFNLMTGLGLFRLRKWAFYSIIPAGLLQARLYQANFLTGNTVVVLVTSVLCLSFALAMSLSILHLISHGSPR